MKKLVYIGVLLAIGLQPCFAQKADSCAKKEVPLFSLGFNGGLVTNLSNPANSSDYVAYQLRNFKEIAPNSHYLYTDFSGFDSLNRSKNTSAVINVFISAPIALKNNTWFDLELRGNLVFNKKQQEAITFTGKDTSLTKSIYSFEFKGNNAGIEISPLFYFNRLKNLYPYIGLSAGIAYSYNNLLTARYNPNGKLYEGGEWGFVHTKESTLVETTSLKNTTSYYLNIPFGIAFKRSKKTTYISPFIDFRYGIKLEKYPTIHYKVIQSMYCQFGFKFNVFKDGKFHTFLSRFKKS